MKFCKDCKWAKRHWTDFIIAPLAGSSWEFAKCLHPTPREQDPVYDKKQKTFCSTERIYRCGPEGKHWEPK